MAAHECLAPVDDDELAMVAVVQHADVAEAFSWKSTTRHPASSICCTAALPIFFRARCVKQDTHLHAGAAALRQRVAPRADRAPLPSTERSRNALSPRRRADLCEQHIEKGAVLEDFDRIARDGCAERQAGERRNQLVDRRVTFNVQVGIAVTSDRPDDEQLNDDDRNDKREYDDRHRGRSHCGHRVRRGARLPACQ